VRGAVRGGEGERRGQGRRRRRRRRGACPTSSTMTTVLPRVSSSSPVSIRRMKSSLIDFLRQ